MVFDNLVAETINKPTHEKTIIIFIINCFPFSFRR